MWRIENPTIRKANLDFTSSGQGFREVSQLMSGEVILMNALELMEWSDDRTQVLVCDHCGFPGCESGNWINLRISGDFVFLIPAFDELENDSWTKTEYGAPRYLKKMGTPYFEVDTYKSLLKFDLNFPDLGQIGKLEMREAMRLAQFEMPFRIFGDPPVVELRREKSGLVVATSDGEPSHLLEIVREILSASYESNSPALLRKPNADEEIVYLFLDAAEFTDWRAMVKRGTEYKLMVEEELVIQALSH